ncbi:hypothetical protein Tco_1284361 [Tanacetum coccineum]
MRDTIRGTYVIGADVIDPHMLRLQLFWPLLSLWKIGEIVTWKSLKEHLECQTSSILMTEELVAVMNQKRQRCVIFSYLDPNLVEEEEDLDHHVISYETYPFQRETHPSM